jgi:hypothetical protein
MRNKEHGLRRDDRIKRDGSKVIGRELGFGLRRRDFTEPQEKAKAR